MSMMKTIWRFHSTGTIMVYLLKSKGFYLGKSKVDRNRFKIVFLIGFLVMLLFSLSLFIFINSDYVKSRKVVDIDWMLGKTIEEISRRYSYPPESTKTYMCDHSPYVICAREIFLYDPIDGVKGEYVYYALLDEKGRVIDVMRSFYGGDIPPQEYDYEDRW